MSTSQRTSQRTKPEIGLTPLRTLTLAAESGHISAASGLVVVGSRAFVAPDNELFIAEFDLSRSTEPGKLIRVFSGVLPSDPSERKKRKPDHEALCLIDGGALLTIPSGSKPSRTRGAVIHLATEQEARAPIEIDFEPLYARLSEEFSDLNIEGALFSRAGCHLFQRGNSKGGENARITLHTAKTLEGLSSARALSRDLIVEIRSYDLGEINGVPLSFTDATTYGNGKTLFLAAAEETDNPFDDGAFAGAIIGALDANGEIEWHAPLKCPNKPEGIAWTIERGEDRFLMVTDADDENVPSVLYEGII